MELKYIVYITINLCNGKFYIGVHRTNPNVFDGYIGNGIYRQSDAKHREKGRPFASAVKKYGYENFKRTILEIFPDSEEGCQLAYTLEAAIVTETLIKSKQCYNVQLGGEVSRHITKRVYKFDLNGNYLRSFMSPLEGALSIPEIIDYKVAQKCITNNCLGTTQSALGFVWSYEKKFNYINRQMKSIAQYTLSGKFIRTFKSIQEAEVTLSLKSIHDAIRNNSYCGNYQWRIFNNSYENIDAIKTIRTKNLNIPIIVIDSNNVQEEFQCVLDCVKKYPKLSSRQINRCLTNKQKTHFGYIFKYKVNDIV